MKKMYQIEKRGKTKQNSWYSVKNPCRVINKYLKIMFGVGVECKLFNSFNNKVKQGDHIMTNLILDIDKWKKLPWNFFQRSSL